MRWEATPWIVIGGALVGAQFVRFAPTNPPVESDVVAPREVQRILRPACYDCHSNETVWPWYSHIAPLSWWTHHEVNEGRRRLNFSQWDAYASDPETASRKLEQIAELVASDDMAPWYYRLLHPSARLNNAQRDILRRWVERYSPPPVRGAR